MRVNLRNNSPFSKGGRGDFLPTYRKSPKSPFSKGGLVGSDAHENASQQHAELNLTRLHGFMISSQRPQSFQLCSPLQHAALDFFFLQNRAYPRRSGLEWVGNRYRLPHLERQLLHRGVFSQGHAIQRLAKRSRAVAWQKEWLVVDGHNVQITVESSLIGRPVLRANDGVIRDLAGQSAKFHMTETSWQAMELVFRFLNTFRPFRTLFLFDAPISQSGILAQVYQKRMGVLGLSGDARAVPVPEREFCYEQAIVASSDQAVMEKASRWVDLASLVLCYHGSLELTADFSSLILTRMACEDFPIPVW
jgi:hypothetical protein